MFAGNYATKAKRDTAYTFAGLSLLLPLRLFCMEMMPLHAGA